MDAPEMSTNVVNLDALIPRDDFVVSSGKARSRIEKISIRDQEIGFFLNALRKPDFQRETASWSPEKVIDLIKTFLDGDLIRLLFYGNLEMVFLLSMVRTD